MRNLSFLAPLQPSLKKVFYTLLFSTFTFTVYGALSGNNFISASAFIGFMLTTILLTDRREAVNKQTTNGDAWVTGIALMLILPLATAYLFAFSIGTLIMGSDIEKTLTGGLVLLFGTAGIFYLIRITSRLFEQKNWKLSFYQ